MDMQRYDPLISIIVPIYNVRDYVSKCIESIVAQSYKKLEIILVDDGSYDGSEKICDAYAVKDRRIKVIHKKNGGLVSARKAGTVAAAGDYILNVDGDDWIGEERIFHAVEHLQQERVDVVHIGGHIKEYSGFSKVIMYDLPEGIYHFGEMHRIFDMLANPDMFFQRLYESYLCENCVKSSLLKDVQLQVSDEILVGEDVLCTWLCILKASSCIIYNDAESYHYTQRQSAMTYSSNPNAFDSIAFLYSQLKTGIEHSRYKGTLDRNFIYMIYYALCTSCDLSSFSDDGFLFPYSQVRKGSRIIVYGAGKFGSNIMRSFSSKKDYTIVFWCDKNARPFVVCGYPVSPIGKILCEEYDFIVVAVLETPVAAEIKRDLLAMCVPEEKIALIDKSVLTHERLERTLGVSDSDLNI